MQLLPARCCRRHGFEEDSTAKLNTAERRPEPRRDGRVELRPTSESEEGAGKKVAKKLVHPMLNIRT
jgi:hypothetical protein